jgi:PAS domain S-box-containing protein
VSVLLIDVPSTLRKDEWEQLIDLVLEVDGILVTDSSGVIIWVNKGFTRLTGYAPEEAIGKEPNLLKSGYQDSTFYKHLWDTIQSGEVWSGLLANKRKDGTYYKEWMVISPLKTKDDTITHYVATKREVEYIYGIYSENYTEKQQSAVLESVVPLMTELKDVTTALEQARSEMHAMLNATSEGIMLLSAEGAMLWLNRAFGSFFHLETKEVTGSHFENLKSHWDRVFEDTSKIMQIINNVKDSQISERRESITQIWPQKRELEIYSAPVENANKKYLGQLFVFRDVTREREVERMKSEFVSLVSHEFRTPLTSIRGYAEMMLVGDAGKLTDEQMDYIKTIFRNATHLTEIVNDLLVVSRLEAGAIKLNISILDIRVIIDETIELLKPQIDAKKLKLKVNVPDQLPEVEGDSQRINQVILNLLSNAYKYTPSGGKINIFTKVKDDFLCLTIEDSGIGMSEDEQNKLFTKFFRAENPETIKAGGTGLGLWITRSFVEMHKGEIIVTSKPGKGSAFTIKLPIKKE